MGNISAYVNYHTELSFVNDLNDQIYNQGSLNHSTLGNIQLWKIKRNTNLELFSFSRHIYYQDSNLLQIHSKRCSLQHGNLLQYYACTQTTPTICGNVETQNFYFEYLSQTLSQLISIRSEPFKEIEIWKIIEQLVDVLHYLQRNGINHGNIKSESIFMKENQKVKVIDSMNTQYSEIQTKQDVHDLGLLIVELMTKQKYHLDVKETVLGLTDKYSLQLLSLVAKMLNVNPEKRPDFIQLQDEIQNRVINSISMSPQRNSQVTTFTIKQLPNKYESYCVSSSTISRKNPHQIFQKKISRRQTSPLPNVTIRIQQQKVSPSRVSPARSPQRFQIQKGSPSRGRFNQVLRMDQVQFRTSSQVQQVYVNSSPAKVNLNGSQASTSGSNGISFYDTFKANLFPQTHRPNENRINIKPHQSQVQKVLRPTDELNLTKTSQQDQ